MEEEHNVFDEMVDFETKMYHFLDPPRSPEIVPSPDGRRESTETVYNNYPSASTSNYYPDTSMYASLNNGDTSTTSPKWFCTQCNRSFAAQFALDQHRRFKHQGYKIHCRYCPHTSTNGYALFLHVQREHSDVEGNGYAINGIKSNSKKAINARRKRRAVKHLPPPPRQSTLSESDVTAAACRTSASMNRSTPPSASTPAYRRNDANDADVVVVAERKANAASLKTGKRKRAAMKIVRQAGIPPLDCDQCGKKFAFHSGLRMHTKMVHSGFRFTCQYCGLHFTNGYAIHRHVNIVHNIIGAVRNSGFSAATPEPQLNGDKETKGTESSSTLSAGVVVDLPKKDLSIPNDDSSNHIRLRLRRKALPSKAIAVSALEWSMDNNESSSTHQSVRRFSAPAAGTSIVDNVSNCSSNEANDHDDNEELGDVIRCILCPFKTNDLEILKLHVLKHKTSLVDVSSSLLVAGHNLRQCPYCSYCTSLQSAYVVHSSSHFLKPTAHVIASSSKTSENKISSLPSTSSTLRCTYCDRRFQCSNELNEHERRHTTRF